MNNTQLTIPEKILISATEKWKTTTAIFTEADITVAAWEQFPESFGLRGYEYPDSRRVLSNIMGQKGLKAKRWIKPLGATRYSLTQSGLDYAKTISQSGYVGLANNSLADSHKRIITRLINSHAWKSWTNDDMSDCVFRDAMMFWNITSAAVEDEFNESQSTIINALDIASNLIDVSGGMLLGRVEMSQAHIDELLALNTYLIKQFDNEVKIIKSYIKSRGQRIRKS